MEFEKQKCDGRHNEVGAPASGIMAGAVLTPWDKDLEPETWTDAFSVANKTIVSPG